MLLLSCQTTLCSLPAAFIYITVFVFKAANYLDIKGLLDVTCKTVANMIKGKTPEEIRKTFNIKNDFTEEEEAQVFIPRCRVLFKSDARGKTNESFCDVIF